MSKKRIITTSVCAALCVLLCVALGVLLWYQSSTAVVENTNNTLDKMLPTIAFADVKRIDVKNKNGAYALLATDDGDIVLESNKYAPLNLYKVQMLLSNVCQTYYTFDADVTAEDFEKYGLSNGAHQAEFKVQTKNGLSYTVYIGDETLANDGYYVRVPDKNAVYVLGYSIENDLLGTSEYLIDFGLVYPTDMNHYFLVNNFSLRKGGEDFIAINFVNANERDEFNSMGIHRLSYPEGYFASQLYTSVLTKFSAIDTLGTNNFMATEILSYNVDEKTLTEHGINPNMPAYELAFGSPIMDDEDTVVAFFPNLLCFSEKQRDENGEYFYYVYSAMKGTLSRVEEITVDFLEWGLDKWVSPYIFQTNIINVDTISFDSKSGSHAFQIDVKDDKVASVKDLKSGQNGDVDNFKNLWKSMLMLTHDGYFDMSESDKEYLINSPENKLLTIKMVTHSGKTREISFYQYTDRRVLYTINGVGEFYLPITMVEKVIADVERFMNGEIIDPEARF